MIDNDDIIGIPSGQVIAVNNNELNTLLTMKLARWDPSMEEFLFKDFTYNRIKKFLLEITKGDTIRTKSRERVAKVVKVVKQYDGSDVMGMSVNRVFELGVAIYVVKFIKNDLIGLYTKNQIEKIRGVDNEII